MQCKKVFITVLSTNDYLKGVLLLNESIKNTNSKYRLVVLVTKSISDYSLTVLNLCNIESILIENEVLVNLSGRNNDSSCSHWNNTFEKLQIFNQVQFDKVVYLDSDMFVIENIDELFDKEHMSAVCAGAELPENTEWKGNLNSGLIVLKPEKKIYEDLIALLPKVSNTLINFGDQDIIQEYVKDDWPLNLWLDDSYNMFSIYIDWYVKFMSYGTVYTNKCSKGEKNIKIVHYIGYPKPWMSDVSKYEIIRYNIKTIITKLLHRDYTSRIVYSRYLNLLMEINKNMKRCGL
jgi:Alpha-N-acetylglucosamine transferase